MNARLLCLLTALALCGACAGSAHPQKAQRAKIDDLSAITAVPGGSVRNGSSGAPVSGVTVTGTITNHGDSSIACRRSSFFLTEGTSSAMTPATQWCDTPAIAPRTSAQFTLTFATPPRDGLTLRFEHPNGTYETHELILPPR